MTKLASSTALVASFALSAALCASVAFFAAAPAAAETTVVPFSDLDVASPAGAEILAQRIKSTCEKPDIRDLQAYSAWQQCKDAALTSAMDQLNSKGVPFDSSAFTNG